MQEPRQIIATGVPGLDTILGGGLPARQTLVVTGNPGTGKTLLCSQIAFAQAARGVPVVVATVTSEPHDKLLDELSAFAFFDEKRLGEEIFFLSAYPWLKKGAKDARELILGTVRERNARLIFIDGLRSIRDLWADEAKLREFMYDLGVGLAASNCVGIMSTEYEVDRLMGYPEATTVDGIISLSVARKGPRRVRHAEVVKLRGRAHLSGAHTLAISGGGVEIYPRFESVAVRDPGYPTFHTSGQSGL
jgi:circadian clock protein KaiC